MYVRILKNSIQVLSIANNTNFIDNKIVKDLNFSKKIPGCDDIIRQHKAACLRVTALLAHRDTLWVGTSAGVLLTAPLHNSPNTRTGVFTVPTLTGWYTQK